MNRILGRSLVLGLLVLAQSACTSAPITKSMQQANRAGSRKTSDKVLAKWADDLKMHTSVGFGYRSVDHRQSAYGDQLMYGLEVDAYRPQDYFGYELGLTFASEEIDITGGQRRSDFYELYLGVRKTFGEPDAPIRPYVSVGGNFINEEVNYSPSNPTADPRATGAGGYARTGAYWRIANIDFDGDTEVIMGVDVRGVLHEDTDFVQAMIYFGVGR